MFCDVLTSPGLVRESTTEAAPTADASAPYPMHRYVVTKLIEGVTLREWLEENPGASAAARLRPLMTVASALDEMHSGRQTEVTVAHGDVKPSNIMLRKDGSSVLVDLGLIHTADGQGRAEWSGSYSAPALFQPGATRTPDADRFAFAATVVHAIRGESLLTSPGLGPDLPPAAARLQARPVSTPVGCSRRYHSVSEGA